MTREEAITRLKNMAWLYGSSEREQNIEAIDMAISALQGGDAEVTVIPEGTGLMQQSPNDGADLISREDAIDAICKGCGGCDDVKEDCREITALKALPSVDRPTGDLISRKDAMKAFAERVRDSNQSDFIEPPNWNDAVAIIGSLPTADRPTGQWIEHENYNECNLCHALITIDFNYCPMCGAKMTKGGEQNDD